MLSDYVVGCYVIMTCVHRDATEADIVMIVWTSIIAVGAQIKPGMATECVQKEHYKVSDSLPLCAIDQARNA